MMKYLLLLILVALPFIGFSQSKDAIYAKVSIARIKKMSDVKKNNPDTSLIKVDYDKMTGKEKISSEIIYISDNDKTSISIYVSLYKTRVVGFFIFAKGAGDCIDNGAAINILFKDSTRMVLHNEGRFNCDGFSMVYFGRQFGKRQELAKLAEKQIAAMRVWTDHGYVQEDVPANKSYLIRKSFQCFVK